MFRFQNGLNLLFDDQVSFFWDLYYNLVLVSLLLLHCLFFFSVSGFDACLH